MLYDGRDKKLIKWLEGTNWPEGFTWSLSLQMVNEYITQKLTIKFDLETITLFLNSSKLTKSDYEAAISIAIKRMSESAAIIKER